MAKRPPARPRREDCFFGLHFDLHPGMKDAGLGQHVTEAMVRRIIRLARPDYIQYDCKGHPGVLGYPDSKVSASSPGIVRDSLAIYRKVTARAGVAMLVHFSGLYDRLACEEHPDWAALKPDGSRYIEEGKTSTFGPYVTQRMIPQMLEVIDRYDVDGFWVDGECWAAVPDYCPQAIARFKDAVGSDPPPPASPDQPHWYEWMSIHRDQFFAYLKLYMDAVHAHRPTVQIASNWLYTPFVPEPVKLPVDFISGDYTANNSVNSARFNGRVMASYGLPWDLMAWAFAWFPGVRGSMHKPFQQIAQEAASVLALGGGFQLYVHPDRHGGFAAHLMQLMVRVADFCHARRDFSHKTQTVPQVAVLIDSTSLLKRMRTVYSPWHGEYRALEGIVHACLEAGHSTDIVIDHQLPWQQDRWPVIVVPEWQEMPQGLVYELVQYARRGGSLLLTGARTVALFKDCLGVRFDGEPVESDPLLQLDGRSIRAFEPGAARAKGLWQSVQPRRGTKVLAWRTTGHHEAVARQPAATLSRLGKGRIAAVYGPIGLGHYNVHNPWLRDLVGGILARLYKPMVSIDRPGRIDVTLREKAGQLIMHLVNTATMATHADPGHDGYFFTDRVPATGPLKLTLRVRRRPRKVMLQPENVELKTQWDPRGVATLHVPDLHIHSAVVVE